MSLTGRKCGFTLIELLFTMALMAIVVAKLTIVLQEAREIHGRESKVMTLEDKAYQVLDRLVYALIGADASTLDPTASFPFFANGLEYKISLGVEDGETVWSEIEYIGLGADRNQLRWGQRMGTEQEQFVTWCNNVSELVEGELVNGIDDNGNEMKDETGLTFTVVGDTVTIILTLEREGDEGDVLQRTVETVVTCRN